MIAFTRRLRMIDRSPLVHSPKSFLASKIWMSQKSGRKAIALMQLVDKHCDLNLFLDPVSYGKKVLFSTIFSTFVQADLKALNLLRVRWSLFYPKPRQISFFLITK
jgi:hypothetical protein